MGPEMGEVKHFWLGSRHPFNLPKHVMPSLQNNYPYITRNLVD